MLQQSSLRELRLMQPNECKVYYLYYQETMQEKAMVLMGKKLLAAEALEETFSSEGLVAMAGDDGIELAMAKSLAENMDELSDRSWQDALDESKGNQRQRNGKPRRDAVVVE